jgi:hypothetical protein
MKKEEGKDIKVNPEDFSPEVHALVDKMVENVKADIKTSKTFSGTKNRKAWKRMNRPEKTAMIDRGAIKMLAIIDRCQPKEEHTETI